MRQTMRKQPNSDEEDDDDAMSRRRRKTHLLKKHPNKHHEGARKRWRDVVTERERKRYEGVWAANKGVPVSAVVLNVVVRDIWSRSRLGNDVLEEVWDLVDRKVLGVLDREEFVVGMWLIDQRLKGRKLPVKVSASVWDSVRAMSGVKIPRNKR
ncbi:MAG: Increased rDNA silencing protein [Phylliscum demangeonii]|nr:MAG: Increased rDNA silencing protein [Phylliscum demangeonii]